MFLLLLPQEVLDKIFSYAVYIEKDPTKQNFVRTTIPGKDSVTSDLCVSVRLKTFPFICKNKIQDAIRNNTEFEMRIHRGEFNIQHLRRENDNATFSYLAAAQRHKFRRCNFIVEANLEMEVAQKILYREIESVFTMAAKTKEVNISGIFETATNVSRFRHIITSLQRNGASLQRIYIESPEWSSESLMQVRTALQESTEDTLQKRKEERCFQKRIAEGFYLL
jgi:predicted transcriptional regulator